MSCQETTALDDREPGASCVMEVEKVGDELMEFLDGTLALDIGRLEETGDSRAWGFTWVGDEKGYFLDPNSVPDLWKKYRAYQKKFLRERRRVALENSVVDSVDAITDMLRAQNLENTSSDSFDSCLPEFVGEIPEELLSGLVEIFAQEDLDEVTPKLPEVPAQEDIGDMRFEDLFEDDTSSKS